MSNTPTVPMIAPDGSTGEIPRDQLQDAIKAGGKVAVYAQAPDGSTGYIPVDRWAEATRNGAKVIPSPDAKSVSAHDVASGIGEGLENLGIGLVAGPLGIAYQSLKRGVSDIESVRKTGKTTGQLEDEQRRAEGHGLLYRVGSQVAEAVGTDVPGMEQAAREGDPGKVVNRWTAATTPVVASTAIEPAAKVAGRAVNALPESIPRAAGQYVGKNITGPFKAGLRGEPSPAPVSGPRTGPVTEPTPEPTGTPSQPAPASQPIERAPARPSGNAGREDYLEDQEITQQNREDLGKQFTQGAREQRAAQIPDKPKWQVQAEYKAQQAYDAVMQAENSKNAWQSLRTGPRTGPQTPPAATPPEELEATLQKSVEQARAAKQARNEVTVTAQSPSVTQVPTYDLQVNPGEGSEGDSVIIRPSVGGNRVPGGNLMANIKGNIARILNISLPPEFQSHGIGKGMAQQFIDHILSERPEVTDLEPGTTTTDDATNRIWKSLKQEYEPSASGKGINLRKPKTKQ